MKFTDQVADFGTQPGRVVVLFQRQAAAYQIDKARADFVDLVAAIAGAWKTGASISVTVAGTDIIGVRPL